MKERTFRLFKVTGVSIFDSLHDNTVILIFCDFLYGSTGYIHSGIGTIQANSFFDQVVRLPQVLSLCKQIDTEGLSLWKEIYFSVSTISQCEGMNSSLFP